MRTLRWLRRVGPALLTAVEELAGERHLALLGAPSRFADAVGRVMPRATA